MCVECEELYLKKQRLNRHCGGTMNNIELSHLHVDKKAMATLLKEGELLQRSQ